MLRIVIAVAAFSLLSSGVVAYQLRPTGTDDERVVVDLQEGSFARFLSDIGRYVSIHYKTNVHEEITHRIWGCDPPEGSDPRDSSCARSEIAPAAVIYGVQWNDNPPFKLDSTSSEHCKTNAPIRLPDRQPHCWIILFYDAAKKASQGDYFRQSNGMALLYRTHFGDLQFQHSMASWNGETTEDTRANILMWAEFTYRVAIGDISASTKISAIPVSGFSRYLGRYWGDVTTLFTFGVNRYRNEIPDVAFGSMLHMIQDSFSSSHTTREYPTSSCDSGPLVPNAGRVLAFLAYGRQDSDKHDKQDSRDAMLAGIRENPTDNVVQVGRHLKKLRDSRAPWTDVKRYLERCVYFVADDDLGNPAGPGDYTP